MNKWILIEFNLKRDIINTILGHYGSEEYARSAALELAEEKIGTHYQYRVAKIRYNYIPPKGEVEITEYPS